MIPTLVPVAALLLGAALLFAGNGLQGVLLPIRAELEAFSVYSIGLIGSTYFLGFGVGCLFGAAMVRHAGHVRTFAAMAAIASAVPLAHALLIAPFPWWVLRGLTGVCFAILYMVIESWLNERATKDTRGRILAAYLFINLTVITVGQMMVILYPPDGFALFALTSMLVSVAAVPVVLSAAPTPAPIHNVRVRLRRLYRISPVGMLGCFGVGLSNGAFWALGPLFAQRSGLGITGIAVFMSATVLAGALGQWPLGSLSDRMDRRKVILAAAGLAGIIGIAVALVSSAPGTVDLEFYVVTSLWGFMAFPLYGLTVAHTNDYAGADEFVEVSSGLLAVFAAGAVIGPMIASVFTAYHIAGLYIFTAIVHCSIGAFVLRRITVRAPVIPEEQVSYMTALEAAETASSVFDEEARKTLKEDAATSDNDRSR